eukprot:gene26506-35169_t
MVFVDSIYLNVFANWLAFYKVACSNDTSSLELVCMDEVSHIGLQRLGLSCSERSFKLLFDRKKSIFDGKLTNIWVKRMELVLDFLREGTDIILSDTDAIWRKNPFPDLAQFAFKPSKMSASNSDTGAATASTIIPPSDIIASRAWWPWPLHHQWGSTVCMGFIYIKATAFTIDLFTHVTDNMREQLFNYTHNISRTRPDDQLAVNYQLFHWNISWLNKKMDVEKNMEPDFGLITYPGTMGSEEKGLSPGAATIAVTLLPHVNYVRHCHNQTKNWRFHSPMMQKVVRKNLALATIAHCRVSTGLGKDKRDYLSAYKLWMIPLSVNNTMHPLYGLQGIPMRGDKNNGLYTKQQILEMIRRRKEMLKRLRKQKKQKALRKRLKEEIFAALQEEEKLKQPLVP